MNPLAGSGVFCAKAGETASRALRPSAAAMAVETTKSRRDRLSMCHLLEKNTPPAPLAPTEPRLGVAPLYSRPNLWVRAATPSHRLERPVDLDIDERRAPILEGMGDEISGLVHGLGALRGNAERARQRDEIDLGIEKLHADIAVGLLGEPAHGVQALLENAIGGVVEDHEDGVDAIARGGPKPLAGIHRAAVADEAYHRPLRQCELHADGGGQAPADAAAAQAEIALRVIAADELPDAGCGGERLLDDDRVLRQHLSDGVQQSERLHRRRLRERAGFRGER